MILVSFSSAEDALSNDVTKYNTFSSQGTENPSFPFFWDTRYIHHVDVCTCMLSQPRHSSVQINIILHALNHTHSA